MKKLWGGRFSAETDHSVEEFTASIGVDARLWDSDITGSIAHARMLGTTGILTSDESHKIIGALEAIRADIASGSVEFLPEAEDIHSEIERLLGEKVGPLAGKLHTARSRNDQVATATRIYLRGQIDAMIGETLALQTWLAGAAEKNTDTLMAGFTHLQHAQPVSLAHHFLAYFWMFDRDRARLIDCRKRVNKMPLGSAALAGTSFPINRAQTSQELGFSAPCENSLDAVSDRDFVVEFLSAASLVMTHLSRLCEEIILWSTPEFGFIELHDSVTTGSSIMPQKKNPDVAELIRGKTGRVNGALVGALTMLKALPLSYNRDLQEDKTFLFEGLDTARASLRLMKLMLESAKFRAERMATSAGHEFSNATDLADYLVRKGLTFRESHEVAGKAVHYCIQQGKRLENLTVDEYRKFSSSIDSDLLPKLSTRAVMEARTSMGGTGPSAVREQLELARRALSASN